MKKRTTAVQIVTTILGDRHAKVLYVGRDERAVRQFRSDIKIVGDVLYDDLLIARVVNEPLNGRAFHFVVIDNVEPSEEFMLEVHCRLEPGGQIIRISE